MALPYRFLEDVAPVALGLPLLLRAFGLPAAARRAQRVPKAVELIGRWVFRGPGRCLRAQRRRKKC